MLFLLQGENRCWIFFFNACCFKIPQGSGRLCPNLCLRSLANSYPIFHMGFCIQDSLMWFHGQRLRRKWGPYWSLGGAGFILGRLFLGLLGTERNKRKVSQPSCLSQNKDHNTCCFISPITAPQLVIARNKTIFTENKGGIQINSVGQCLPGLRLETSHIKLQAGPRAHPGQGWREISCQTICDL